MRINPWSLDLDPIDAPWLRGGRNQKNCLSGEFDAFLFSGFPQLEHLIGAVSFAV